MYSDMSKSNSSSSCSESEDEQEHQEKANCGDRGVDCGCCCEAFVALLLVLLISSGVGDDSGTGFGTVDLILAGMIYFSHFVIQALPLIFPDLIPPGKVSEALRSLNDNTADAQTLAILEDLRSLPPRIEHVAEAFHQEIVQTEHGSSIREVIDRTEKTDFQYASWKDLSGHIKGLDKHAVCVISINVEIKNTDGKTTKAAQDELDMLEGRCKPYMKFPDEHNIPFIQQCLELNDHMDQKNPNTRTRTHFYVGPALQEKADIVTRNADYEHPFWMSTTMYTFCRLAFPGLGAIYRIAFWSTVKRVTYNIIKEVSVSPQHGSGWTQAGSAPLAPNVLAAGGLLVRNWKPKY